MLILTRRPGESIYLGDNQQICFTYLRSKGNQISIGITAPKEMPIAREELIRDGRVWENHDEQE